MAELPGQSAAVRRLLPDPGAVTIAEQLAVLNLGRGATEDLPYVVLNFAATLDGRASVDGRSGKIGSDVDTEVLQRLRTRADAVMIGAGTLRAERYGRMVSDPALREERERNGLAHDPLAVVVSNRLDVPWDAPLFTDGGGRVVIFTASGDSPPATETPVKVMRHEGGVDLERALSWLRHTQGVRSVLCEGGPTLHGGLRSRGLVHELFLTIAPKLAGGSDLPILLGELQSLEEMRLLWLLEHDGELFARYGMRTPVQHTSPDPPTS